LLINRDLAALARAEALGGMRGPYVLRRDRRLPCGAFRPQETGWAHITSLYSVLAEVTPSPIVELNRAVAVSMAFGRCGRP
jgi:predicted RNA polymerase sigma factor